tara:strand:+ start:852 stop:1076 length:225 start_codon:yes stop_codon:yes gene_type:complete
MYKLTIHENNTGTVEFETEEELRAWIKDPFFENVEWDYADYEVFHRTFFVEKDSGTAYCQQQDITNWVWNENSA